MKNNLIVLGIMSAFLLLFSYIDVSADTQTEIKTTLYGNSIQKAGTYINDRPYAALYTESATYNTLFTVADANGNYDSFYIAPVNATYTLKKENISGPNTIVQLYLKSEKFHLSNSYVGRFFH